jgi:hypothetical protein
MTLDCHDIPRRSFVAGSLTTAIATGLALAQDAAGAPDPMCPRCDGIGRVPIGDAKPWVWMKGNALPRWDAALVGEQFCPVCQSEHKASELVAEAKSRLEAALEKNKQWDERTGWKLACVVTRHAAVHTQLTPVQARAVGQALEMLTLHLKRVTDSLQLASTHPDTLELMMLWEKPAWDHFRKVMEKLYTLQQLGPSWASAQLMNAYDHFVTPHTYETPKSINIRPPSCGAVFIVGRRQLNMATDWRAPFWLAEGFSAYCDNVVHKINRWYSVYDVKTIPIGDWLVNAKKLAGESKLRAWKDMMSRELRDWEWEDHVQTTAAAAFLLESEPAKFLKLLKRLRDREDPAAALEETYKGTLDDLQDRCAKWLAKR